jgi:hypothetical protein
MKIKSYIYIGIATTLLALASALCITLKSKSSIEKKYKEAVENVKSYSEQFSTATNKNRALKLTIEQLNYSNDSILQELNASRKELKVKDSKLQSMQYVASSFTKADTIVLRDTIFKDTKMDIDTLVSDEWYSVKVGLKYPSTIAVSPEFKSVKNIIVSAKKEAVDPPKKFFLFRWFQKKHYVLNIDVVEKNPYVQNQVNRYVEIVK